MTVVSHNEAVDRLLALLARDREDPKVTGEPRWCQACDVKWWGGPVCWCCDRAAHTA